MWEIIWGEKNDGSCMYKINKESEYLLEFLENLRDIGSAGNDDEEPENEKVENVGERRERRGNGVAPGVISNQCIFSI